MQAVQRWPLWRLEAGFSWAKSRIWDVVVPYALISVSYSFVTWIAVPFVLPEGLAAVAILILAVFGILLSAALTVGAYAEILSPSSPVPSESFSFDAVTAFFDRSWRELRKCLWTFYYVFEYAYLIPFAVGFLLFVIFGVAAYSGMPMAPNPMVMMQSGPLWILVSLAVLALVVLVAYRQLKSVFAVVHAIEVSTSDRSSFKASLAITDDKWWRAFGNFFVAGLVFVGIMVVLTLAWGVVVGLFSMPDSAIEFLAGIPGAFFSVFMAFFTYELYKDFVPATPDVDSVFVP